MTRDELRALAEELERSIYYTNHKAAAILRQIADAQPVATVRTHRTGGNAGIAWSAVSVESPPLLRDGEPLYTLPLED